MQAKAEPPARAVGVVRWRDVWASYGLGVKDYLRSPYFGAVFGGVFTLGGLLILSALYTFHTPWLILPLLTVIPLLGPFAAAGYYETSRRLEQDEPLRWRPILAVVWGQRERQLAWMGFIALAIIWTWMFLLRILYALMLAKGTMGSVELFVHNVLTSPGGSAFAALSLLVCMGFGLVTFSVSVIAMPLLFETDQDFVQAMRTSCALVRDYPGPMLTWGGIAGLLAILATLPAFLGLVAIAPILGHTTWHLYRRIYAPDRGRGAPAQQA